ncbi:glycoside hydrolase family 3 N-terminal domain-containing protein [Streptomyces sp. 11x1]|uniref:glycoside hydrolase family 3 protein n=1 Tax=Streptomyces sp. 11x1 TaxID=3038642 RepID=UPI002930E2BB|nr:glycoside hydrolase family 3 N-terminal domain-containing protein [Streptomyces sp. 11x1]WNZ08740.1 glycoside hydrolase family 3 N-terminal domain-containing protein [Streptomyces sp. 11x1]
MSTAPYRDPSRPVDERVEDLLARMTLAEKAGQLFHSALTMNGDGTLAEASDGPSLQQGTTELVVDSHLTHFHLVGRHGTRETAEWVNRLQALAADTRLGIPVTLSTGPRHSFTARAGAPFGAAAFSAWPDPLGLAAIGDPELVEKFGDTVRREYLALGLRVALHPRIDLATGPHRAGRAHRSNHRGSPADVTSALFRAYVRGLQGPRLGPRSVVAVATYCPGGPQQNGGEPHFAQDRDRVRPRGTHDHRLAPVRAAVEAGCSQMMPHHGRRTGVDGAAEIGFGLDRDALTGLPRERHGLDRVAFDGVVRTDRGLLTDAPALGDTHRTRAWGLGHLTVAERAAKALDAGADQFGGDHGEQCPEMIVELVRSGRIAEERIDASVRRILREKFVLGLFERRYVDPDRAEETVGAGEFTALGEAAQRRSLTVLANHSLLPLTDRPNLYVEGVGAQTASLYGNVVADPAHADVAVLRLRTPSEERLVETLALLAAVPTLVCVNLQRPAALPEIAAKAAALVADYGASDTALLDVAFGRARAEGRLPFELPHSLTTAEPSHRAAPDDTEPPLFPYGHGLTL